MSDEDDRDEIAEFERAERGRHARIVSNGAVVSTLAGAAFLAAAWWQARSGPWKLELLACALALAINGVLMARHAGRIADATD